MDILKYLKSYMIESNWAWENVPEQARALFTSWCLMGDIETDTKDCDNALIELYDAACLSELDVDFENFYNFMVSLIV